MFITDNLSMELKHGFKPEGYIPLMKAFDKVGNIFDEQKNNINMIKNEFTDYKEKEIDRKVEIKKDLLIEIASKADIYELKGKFTTDLSELKGELKSDIKELKGEIKALEIKMDGNFREIRKEMDGNRKELKGDIAVLDAKFTGEFKSIRLWMKLLVGIAIIGITFFSPATVELIKLFKI